MRLGYGAGGGSGAPVPRDCGVDARSVRWLPVSLGERLKGVGCWLVEAGSREYLRKVYAWSHRYLCLLFVVSRLRPFSFFVVLNVHEIENEWKGVVSFI